VPMSLLFALAGLALVGVFQQALTSVAAGPLRLGPLFVCLVASSQMTLLGLGPLFWALVVGTGVSLLLEGRELGELRSNAPVGS
jgi:benzoate membrane transport protein